MPKTATKRIEREKKDKYWNEKQLARDFFGGLNDVVGRGGIAGLVGAPGDIANMAENGLRALIGKPQVSAWGGSEHIGQKLQDAGLVSDVRRPKTELLASLISPASAAKTILNAPKTARLALKALDNLDAPNSFRRGFGNSQVGGIEVGNIAKMVAPQDEALRVAQANAAKPVSEGGLGLRPDNTPEERAAAMGFTTDAYHGTRANFDAFDINRHGEATDDGWYGKGFYFAPNPEDASGYAMIDMKNTPLNVAPTPKAQGSVMPVKLRLNEPYVTDRQLAGHVVDDLRGKGYDSIVAADYTYDPISKANEIVTFDPRNIRSRFAAFDPMRKDSSDLLAGLAPLGLGALIAPREKKKKRP